MNTVELPLDPRGDRARAGGDRLRRAALHLRRARGPRAPPRGRARRGSASGAARASPRCTPTRTATSRRTTRPRCSAACSSRSTTAPSGPSSSTCSSRARRSVLLVGERYVPRSTRCGRGCRAADADRLRRRRDGDLPGYEALLADARAVEEEADVEDDETTILMYTSGTTSLPKGVHAHVRRLHAPTSRPTSSWPTARRAARRCCARRSTTSPAPPT